MWNWYGVIRAIVFLGIYNSVGLAELHNHTQSEGGFGHWRIDLYLTYFGWLLSSLCRAKFHFDIWDNGKNMLLCTVYKNIHTVDKG